MAAQPQLRIEQKRRDLGQILLQLGSHCFFRRSRFPQQKVAAFADAVLGHGLPDNGEQAAANVLEQVAIPVAQLLSVVDQKRKAVEQVERVGGGAGQEQA